MTRERAPLAVGGEAWTILAVSVGKKGARRVDGAGLVRVVSVPGLFPSTEADDVLRVRVIRSSAPSVRVGEEREARRGELYAAASRAEHAAFGREAERLWGSSDPRRNPREKRKPGTRKRDNPPATAPTNVPFERLASTRTIPLAGVEGAEAKKKARADHAARARALEIEVGACKAERAGTARELAEMRALLEACRKAPPSPKLAARELSPTFTLTIPEPRAKRGRRNPGMSVHEVIGKGTRLSQSVTRGDERAAASSRKRRTIILRPAWHWAKREGKWNPELRAALRGQSGVYAIRDARTGTVLYVGESHTGRIWKTLQRHFQAVESFARVDEWTHARPELVEVSVWTTRHGAEALRLEERAIRRLRPSGVVREPAPF